MEQMHHKLGAKYNLLFIATKKLVKPVEPIPRENINAHPGLSPKTKIRLVCSEESFKFQFSMGLGNAP